MFCTFSNLYFSSWTLEEKPRSIHDQKYRCLCRTLESSIISAVFTASHINAWFLASCYNRSFAVSSTFGRGQKQGSREAVLKVVMNTKLGVL